VSIRRGFRDLLASSETGAQRKKMISTMVPLGLTGEDVAAQFRWRKL
jgi:hypothetical protein